MRDLDKPSVITVMEKRASTGKVTDWRFLMIRLSDRRVVQRNAPDSCIDCHSRYEKTGFVSLETDSLLTAFAGGLPPVEPPESKRRKSGNEANRDSAKE